MTGLAGLVAAPDAAADAFAYNRCQVQNFVVRSYSVALTLAAASEMEMGTASRLIGLPWHVMVVWTVTSIWMSDLRLVETYRAPSRCRMRFERWLVQLAPAAAGVVALLQLLLQALCY